MKSKKKSLRQKKRLKVDPIGIKEIWVNGINKDERPSGKLLKEFLS